MKKILPFIFLFLISFNALSQKTTYVATSFNVGSMNYNDEIVWKGALECQMPVIFDGKIITIVFSDFRGRYVTYGDCEIHNHYYEWFALDNDGEDCLIMLSEHGEIMNVVYVNYIYQFTLEK